MSDAVSMSQPSRLSLCSCHHTSRLLGSFLRQLRRFRWHPQVKNFLIRFQFSNWACFKSVVVFCRLELHDQWFLAATGACPWTSDHLCSPHAWPLSYQSCKMRLACSSVFEASQAWPDHTNTCYWSHWGPHRPSSPRNLRLCAPMESSSHRASSAIHLRDLQRLRPSRIRGCPS